MAVLETWKCTGCDQSAPGITAKNSSTGVKLIWADVEEASGKTKEQLGSIPGYEIMRKCASCGAPFCTSCISSKMKKNWLSSYNRATCPSCGDKFGCGAVLVYFKGLDDELNSTPLAILTVTEELKASRDVEGLIRALQHKDWTVRQKAAETLGEIKDARAVKPLTQVLKDKYEDVRQKAAEALVKMGRPSVESLIQALKDEEVWVRRRTAEALGKIKDARGTGSLIQALKDVDHWWIRAASAWAIGEIRNERAIEPLNESLNIEEDKRVQVEVALALEKIKGLNVLLDETETSDPEAMERYCPFCLKPVSDASTCPYCDKKLVSPPHPGWQAAIIGYLYGGLIGGIALVLVKLVEFLLHFESLWLEMVVFGGAAYSAWQNKQLQLSIPSDIAVSRSLDKSCPPRFV